VCRYYNHNLPRRANPVTPSQPPRTLLILTRVGSLQTPWKTRTSWRVATTAPTTTAGWSGASRRRTTPHWRVYVCARGPARRPLCCTNYRPLPHSHLVQAARREAVDVGRMQTVQAGFDKGYGVGIVLGLVKGRAVGALRAAEALGEVPVPGGDDGERSRMVRQLAGTSLAAVRASDAIANVEYVTTLPPRADAAVAALRHGVASVGAIVPAAAAAPLAAAADAAAVAIHAGVCDLLATSAALQAASDATDDVADAGGTTRGGAGSSIDSPARGGSGANARPGALEL